MMKISKNIRLVFLLLFIISLNSCKEKRSIPVNKDNLQGIWIGGALNQDKNFYKPITRILEFKDDSLYYKNLNGEIRFRRRIRFSKDSITLDSLNVPLHKFKLTKDQLRFIDIDLHRLISTSNNIDVVAFDKFLSSTDWKIEDESGIYRFNNKEKNFRFQLDKDSGYFKYCYELNRYQDKLFLIKKGNQLACDRDYQFVEQVLSYDDSSIHTFGFRNGEFRTIKYRSVSNDNTDPKPVNFQLCNQYINKNYPRDRYYYQGTEYNGGLYHIRKIFNKKYVVPTGNTESGIFQVRFVVNCQGKAGMYETQAFDNDYKLKEFSPKISSQILEITKNLQDWIPGKRPRSNQVIDTYIYLSFRIKDGKIILIYP